MPINEIRHFIMPTPGDVPCPQCGYLNTPQSERCGVCGCELPGHPHAEDEPAQPDTDED